MRLDAGQQPIRLLTIQQVAAQLCCSAANVYGLVETGKLIVVRIGKSKGYRVDPRDLETFITEQKCMFQTPHKSTPKTKLKHINL